VGRTLRRPDRCAAVYEQLMKAQPDLEIDVQHRHVTEEAILWKW